MIATTVINGKTVRYFATRFFFVDNRKYEIIETRSTGRGIYDAIDTVKNDEGRLKEFTRLQLLEFAKNNIYEEHKSTAYSTLPPENKSLGVGRRGRKS